MCEDYISSDLSRKASKDNRYYPYLEDFYKWCKSEESFLRNYKVLLIEQRLVNSEYNIYGHPDLVLINGDSVKIVDYKTSISKQKWWKCQLAAYSFLFSSIGSIGFFL